MNSVYQINKGINKPIEFKGLKAQYIWYMGGLGIGLMIVFAILYIVGISQYICLAIVGVAGMFGVSKIFEMSKKYGEHGLSKLMARKRLPKALKSVDRSIFLKSNG